MALREAIIAEAFNLFEAAFRKILLIAPRHHAADKLVLEVIDGAVSPEGRHRPAQPVRLWRRKPGGHNRNLHGLLLKERHPHGLTQHLAQFIRGKINRLFFVPSPQIRMHHVPLNGTGPHNRHLHHQVIKGSRLEPRQHGHLRPALHLEDTDRVRLAQHVINRRIILRHGPEPMTNTVMGFQEIKCLSDAGQHAKCQNIDFENTQRVEIVLVPLNNSAVFHRCILDRYHFFQSPPCDHKPAHMLRKVPWKPDQLACKRERHRDQWIIRIKSCLSHFISGHTFR